MKLETAEGGTPAKETLEEIYGGWELDKLLDYVEDLREKIFEAKDFTLDEFMRFEVAAYVLERRCLLQNGGE